MDLGEDALHLLETGPAAAVAADLLVIGAAPVVEAHAAALSLEEFGAEMVLQHADAVGDGGRGDAELVGSQDEAPVPGVGFEEAQAVERRQGYHGFGREERWGPDETNTSFVLHKCTFF